MFVHVKVCMVCLCMWGGGANAKVIHVLATALASQRPGVTRATLEIKKSDADSDFPHFSPRVDVDRGDFGVEED